MPAMLVFAAKDLGNAEGARKGDPMQAFDVGTDLGRLGMLPPAEGGCFARLIISDADVTKEKLQPFCDPDWGEEYVSGMDPDGSLVYKKDLLKKRLWSIKVSELPQAIRVQINTTGEVTRTKAQILNFLRNKNTDEEANF